MSKRTREDNGEAMSKKKESVGGRLVSLEDALGNLPSLLNQKLADLENREEALKKAEEAFATERAKVYGDSAPSDVLELNVGGTHCTVLRSTLCQVEDSMLASRFSGRWDDALEKDANGRFVIDQSMEFFGILLNYLRSHANMPDATSHLTPPTFKTNQDEAHFKIMIDFYGCTDLIYPPARVKLIRANQDMVNISTTDSKFEVVAESLSTFLIEGPHSEQIKSFEIVLDDATQAMIGWATPQIAKSDHIQSNLGSSYDIWSSTGVDRVSMALNCSTQQIFGQGISNLGVGGSVSLAKGTTIRCEREGCIWYCNGSQVAHGNTFMDRYSSSYRIQPHEDRVPAFACQGKVFVTNVVF